MKLQRFNPGIFRRVSPGAFRAILFSSVVASAIITGSFTGFDSPALAANGDQLDRQTTDLVNSVQQFLTVQGKWPPPAGSPEMQLCSALQSFTQEVKRAPDISTASNIGGSQQRLAVQRLASSAQQVDSSLSAIAPNADVSSRWISIKSQISAASNYAYGMVPSMLPGNATIVTPGNYPGTYPGAYPGMNPGMYPGVNSGIYNPMVNPGYYNQGFNNQGFNNQPFGNQGFSNQGFNNQTNTSFSSYANNLDSEMRGFSSFVQKSVMQGGFANRDQSSLMTLTAALQNLQNTVKQTVNSLRGSGNIMQQQQNVQQLSMAITQFEPAFNASQPNAMVSTRYMRFKSSFMTLQQAVMGNGMLLR